MSSSRSAALAARSSRARANLPDQARQHHRDLRARRRRRRDRAHARAHSRQAWNQQVIVENKPGGNTQIAADYVAKAAPDGHTLLLGPDVTFTVNPHLYRKLSYDPVKDFEPITGLTVLHQALVTHPSLAANSVAGADRAREGEARRAQLRHVRAGSAGHLNMEALQSQAGVKLTAVHYRGAAPAMTDVIAGHIQLMFVSFGSALQSWKAGQLKMLAIGSPEAACPTIRTCRPSRRAACPASRRNPGSACSRPAARRATIVAKINADVRKVIESPDFRDDFLAKQMMQSITSTPEAYAELIRTDSRLWAR